MNIRERLKDEPRKGVWIDQELREFVIDFLRDELHLDVYRDFATAMEGAAVIPDLEGLYARFVIERET